MKKRCCANCVYAVRPAGRWLRVFLSRCPGLLICANSTEAPGELRGVAATATCPNFRARREPPVWTVPPQSTSDGIRYIALTQGQFAIVDAEDYPRLSRYKWHAVDAGDGHGFYARRHEKGRSVWMHREIVQPPKGMVVDHIDGNGLNNRRSNLRICTRTENGRNRRKNRDGKNEFKGIWHDKDTGKCYATIRCNGEPIYLGAFDSAIEAARAYDRKAVEVHGKYARLNFPEEWPPQRREAVMEGARICALAQKHPDASEANGSGGNP
jgi:hypothetical protein